MSNHLVTVQDLLNGCRTAMEKSLAARLPNQTVAFDVISAGHTAMVEWREQDGLLKGTLTLPQMAPDARLTRAEADAITAYWIHESLHVLHSKMETIKKAAKENIASLVNAMEDCRIEKTDLCGPNPYYGNGKKLLNQLIQTMVTRGEERGGLDPNDIMELPWLIAVLGRVEHCGYQIDEIETIRSRMGDKIKIVVDMALDAIGKAKNDHDLLLAARRIAKKLQELFDQQYQENEGKETGQPDQISGTKGAKGKGSGKGKKSNQEEQENGEGSGESSSEGSGESSSEGSEEGNSDKEGQNESEPLKSGKDLTPADEKPSDYEINEGKAEKSGKELTDSSRNASTGGGEQETTEIDFGKMKPSEPSIDEIAEKTWNKSECEDMHHYYKDRVASLNNFKGPKMRGQRTAYTKYERAYSDLKNEMKNSAKLRMDLRRLIHAPEQIKRSRFQDSGRLDLRAPGRVLAGASNTFKRKSRQEGINTAASLLLDLSSSMSGPEAYNTAVLAINAAEAMESAGARVEILGFMGDNQYSNALKCEPLMEVLKGFDQKCTSVKGILGGIPEYPDGGTAMAPAMLAAKDRLLKQKHVNRRMLFVLCDGGCGYGEAAVRAAGRIVLSHNIDLVGFGIGYKVDNLFPLSVTVQDVSQIGKRGLGVLVKQIEAWHRSRKTF